MKERIHNLLNAMSTGVFEREEIIALSLLGAFSGESVFLRQKCHHSCGGHKHKGNRSEDRIGITNLSQLHQRQCK